LWEQRNDEIHIRDDELIAMAPKVINRDH